MPKCFSSEVVEPGATRAEDETVVENPNEESDSDESVERFGDQYSDLIYNQDDSSDEEDTEDREFCSKI